MTPLEAQTTLLRRLAHAEKLDQQEEGPAAADKAILLYLCDIGHFAASHAYIETRKRIGYWYG